MIYLLGENANYKGERKTFASQTQSIEMPPSFPNQGT